jgi:N-acetylglucosamine kinase-like BadF-type ATPase
LVDAHGRELARSVPSVGGTNLNHSQAGVVAGRLRKVVASLVAPLGVDRVEAACIGTAGIDKPGDRGRFRNEVVEELRDLWDPDKVEILSDIEIVSACSDQAARVCLIAGTGSNCLGGWFDGLLPAKPDEVIYVGGIGIPLTDWGSAARMGLQALEHAVRAACGLDERSQLSDATFGYLELGYQSWREIKVWTDEMFTEKGRIAHIAEDVIAPVGIEQRCPKAIAILDEAATELSLVVRTCLRRMRLSSEAVEILCEGGVLHNNPYVNAKVFAGVHREFPAAEFRLVRGVDGAAKLAVACGEGRVDLARWTPRAGSSA